jgi:hypothetical protein
MKRIVRVRADGSVEIGSPNQALIAMMMDEGYGWDQERIDYEIKKWVHPPDETHLGALPPRPKALDVATVYVETLAHGGVTENVAVATIAAMFRPSDTVEDHIVEQADLPAEHTLGGKGLIFRAAWRWSSASGVYIDMPEARGIQMNRIRKVRNKALADSDVNVSRAEDKGDTVLGAQERVRRQVLRDIPQTFDLASYDTPEKLKLAWPVELENPGS